METCTNYLCKNHPASIAWAGARPSVYLLIISVTNCLSPHNQPGYGRAGYHKGEVKKTSCSFVTRRGKYPSTKAASIKNQKSNRPFVVKFFRLRDTV
jgi:hypothetical protein